MIQSSNMAHRGIVAAMGCIVWLLASLIGCVGPTEVTCRGICPAPEAGVVVDEGVVQKSTWLTEDRLGTPDGARRSLCAVQVNNTPEDEILLRGSDGALLITLDQGQPDSTTLLPSMRGAVLNFVDADQDGEMEYVIEGTDLFRYMDSNADLLFETAGVHWTTIDLNEDGIFEFVVRSQEGIFVLSADGSVRTRIGEDLLDVFVATSPIDGSLVFVTSEFSANAQPINFAVWTLDGDPIPHVDGAALQAMGLLNIVGGPASVEFDCHSCTDLGSESESATVALGFFRAEFSYSQTLTSTPTFVGPESSDISTTRTIMKVLDTSDQLVYHEVLASGSGPCSLAVIGEGVVLVADDEQIVEYSTR